MDEDIIDQGIEDPRKVASDAGLRFALTEAVFSRWWKSIPPEYRDEFVTLHHGCPGGNLDLPRFVCALDHLLIQQNRAQQPGVIVDAWALALGARPHDEGLAQGAGEAWKHDAVQQLLFRIRDSQTRQAAARIERLLTANLEADLLSEDPKKRESALKNGLAFMRLAEERQKAESEQRLKSGMERLEKDAAAAKRAFERPSEAQAIEYMKTLLDIYPPGTFEGLLRAALPAETT